MVAFKVLFCLLCIRQTFKNSAQRARKNTSDFTQLERGHLGLLRKSEYKKKLLVALTALETELVVARWEGQGKEQLGSLQQICTHTAIFKMDKQQSHTVQHREFCSILCGSLDEREVLGKMNTYICVAESPCYAPETITTLLISYAPI